MDYINKIDCHLHTKFSADGAEEPEDMIKAAIEGGVSHIAFTDHLEIDANKPENTSLKTLALGRDILLDLKEKYKNKIYVCVGIECGWTEKTQEDMSYLLSMLKYEYVINSVHEVDGIDCYYQTHFENKTKERSYGDYFGAVLKSLDAPYRFDAIGHLAYIERTAPYSDKKARYADYAKTIDKILIKMIEKEVILELNTNVYGALSKTLPDTDILTRYKQLGGKYITFSSDAHKIARILENYSYAADTALSAGFTDWTVYRCGKKVSIPIK